MSKGEEQLTIMDLAQEGDFARRIVMGPQQPAGFPQFDDGRDIFVAAGANDGVHDAKLTNEGSRFDGCIARQAPFRPGPVIDRHIAMAEQMQAKGQHRRGDTRAAGGDHRLL